jgi:hypothetical protein
MLLAGCSGPAGPGTHAGDAYIVKSQRTLFYTFGPAQATGADFALTHGARVTMLSYDYGYSQIAIQGTGQTGYVPTEDLAPAPPLPKPSPTPAHHRYDDAEFRSPSGDGQPRIPLPEFPETMPPPGAPAFRY